MGSVQIHFSRLCLGTLGGEVPYPYSSPQSDRRQWLSGLLERIGESHDSEALPSSEPPQRKKPSPPSEFGAGFQPSPRIRKRCQSRHMPVGPKPGA